MYPDFTFLKRGNVSIWIGRKYADAAFVDRLADADRLFDDPGCQMIKDQRKIKVARIEVMIRGLRQPIYIKRYNAFSLRYKLLSVFGQSGAYRALRGAAILQNASIATAPPVAAIESRVRGILAKSFYVSEEIRNAKTADAYWLEKLSVPPVDIRRRRDFVRSLAELFRSLHARGIYHNDLKDANILTVGRNSISADLYLLDLEGIKLYRRLGERRRIKNLVQLNRTLGRYFHRSDKLRFFKIYCGDGAQDRMAVRQVIGRVVAESERLDIAKGLWRSPGEGVGNSEHV